MRSKRCIIDHTKQSNLMQQKKGGGGETDALGDLAQFSAVDVPACEPSPQ